MSSKFKMAVFFLILPVAVLAHDIYLMQESKQSFDLARLSSLGFIMDEYIPDSVAFIRDMASKDIYSNFIVPILKIKTSIYAALPSLVLFLMSLRESVKKRMTTGKSHGSGSLKGRTFNSESSKRILGKRTNKK